MTGDARQLTAEALSEIRAHLEGWEQRLACGGSPLPPTLQNLRRLLAHVAYQEGRLRLHQTACTDLERATVRALETALVKIERLSAQVLNANGMLVVGTRDERLECSLNGQDLLHDLAEEASE